MVIWLFSLKNSFTPERFFVSFSCRTFFFFFCIKSSLELSKESLWTFYPKGASVFGEKEVDNWKQRLFIWTLNRRCCKTEWLRRISERKLAFCLRPPFSQSHSLPHSLLKIFLCGFPSEQHFLHKISHTPWPSMNRPEWCQKLKLTLFAQHLHGHLRSLWKL